MKVQWQVTSAQPKPTYLSKYRWREDMMLVWANSRNLERAARTGKFCEGRRRQVQQMLNDINEF